MEYHFEFPDKPEIPDMTEELLKLTTDKSKHNDGDFFWWLIILLILKGNWEEDSDETKK